MDVGYEDTPVPKFLKDFDNYSGGSIRIDSIPENESEIGGKKFDIIYSNEEMERPIGTVREWISGEPEEGEYIKAVIGFTRVSTDKTNFFESILSNVIPGFPNDISPLKKRLVYREVGIDGEVTRERWDYRDDIKLVSDEF